MATMSTCLWFATEAEDAARFYCAAIPGAAHRRVIVRTPPGVPGPEGAMLLVTFTLAGAPMLALNAAPAPPFTNAISLVATCADQAELDRVGMRCSMAARRRPAAG